MNNYQNRFKIWKNTVARWATLNNLTIEEAYKFLKLLYWYENSQEISYRDLKWAEFDIFMEILEQEQKNK